MSDMRHEPTDIHSRRPPRHTRCNFCGRDSGVAGRMVEGPGDVYICGDCVEIAYGIILQQRARLRVGPDPNDPAHLP